MEIRKKKTDKKEDKNMVEEPVVLVTINEPYVSSYDIKAQLDAEEEEANRHRILAWETRVALTDMYHMPNGLQQQLRHESMLEDEMREQYTKARLALESMPDFKTLPPPLLAPSTSYSSTSSSLSTSSSSSSSSSTSSSSTASVSSTSSTSSTVKQEILDTTATGSSSTTIVSSTSPSQDSNKENLTGVISTITASPTI